MKPYSPRLDCDRARLLSKKETCDAFEAFCFPDRRVIPFGDRTGRQELFGNLDNQLLSPIHCQGQSLQNQMCSVPIDNESRQSVAFTPYHSPWVSKDPEFFAASNRL